MPDQWQCQLLGEIEAAFAGVTLGEGISLHEAAVIEGYGGPDERRQAKAVDEQTDWRKLVRDPALPRLVVDYYAFCFLDAAGFRFYLPACLSYTVLHPEFDADVVAYLRTVSYWTLGYLDAGDDRLADRPAGWLTALTAGQRACVRGALQYLRGLLDPLPPAEALAELEVEDYQAWLQLSHRAELAANLDRGLGGPWADPAVGSVPPG